jgi:aminobenzoyl-glutamate utilization protein B
MICTARDQEQSRVSTSSPPLSPRLRRVADAVAAQLPQANHLSDSIGRLAEPGLGEYQSAQALVDYLRAAGFEVSLGVANMPTAFVAEAGSDGPVIGLMCEYDATPGDSQQPVPYPAPIAPDAGGFPDVHNAIGAASAGAAVATLESLKSLGLGGRVRVFGTPAEKICLGKPHMARAGLFDGLDAMLAWHPRFYSTVEWDSGPGCYEAQVFDFEGLSVYASSPWAGVSALDGVTLMNVIVQYLREHIPRHYAASINEIITRGGQHPTALPSYAQAWYVYRSPLLEAIGDIRERLRRAADAADRALGTRHAQHVVAATRPWLPNHVLAEHCFANLQAAGPPRPPAESVEFGRQMLAALGRPTDGVVFDETITDLHSGATQEFAGGADDVTEFCWHAPTARIYVAHGLAYPRLPNWTGAALALGPAAHATIASAARTLAFSAVEAVAHPELLDQARAEFSRRASAAPLAPLLPEDAQPPRGVPFGAGAQ